MRLLALAAAILFSVSVSAAESAATTARLNVRAAPSLEAEVIGRLAKGARVAVLGCDNGWCRVRSADVSGYASARYLRIGAPARSGKGYTNSRGEWVPSPTYSPSGPPPGASARCRDGTYSFSRSRRGTCSHHGGVAQWLK